MALVANVDNAVTLRRASLHFVMHLRHERAYRINDETTLLFCGEHNFWSRAMGGEHDRRTLRNIIYRFNKNHALFFKSLYNGFVVHDLMKAIDGSGEGANHPRKSLYRHLYTGTESAWSREQNRIHPAAFRIIDRLLHHGVILLMSPLLLRACRMNG